MKQFFWLIIWFIPIVAFSQKKATFSFQNKPIVAVLFSLEKTYDVRFSYADELVNNTKISLPKKQRTLVETLLEIEEKTTLNFEQISERYIIVKKAKTNLDETQQLEEVVLVDYLTQGITKHKKGYYKVDANKLNILPGLLEADILESLQQLPSVISPNETATGLIVRGGTSDQNRILWDGINIYHSGHLFGMISPFNPAISQKIVFHNKGTNARFGERVSSVIDIKTNATINKELKASINLNGISASAFIETPIIKDKLSLQLSARRSYVDIFQTPTYDKLTDKVFQATNIVNSSNTVNDFFFMDFNAKINYKINSKNRLSFSGILIDNQLDYSLKEEGSNITSSDLLKIKNEGYSVNLESNWNRRIRQITKASFSKYRLNYNYIQKDEIAQQSNFNKRNVIYDTNISTEFQLQTYKKDRLNLGYQYSFKDVGYAFLNTTNIALLLDFDENEIDTHAFFANYSLKSNQFIDVEAGFRLNYYKEFDKLKLEPRIVIYKNLFKGLKLQFTGEIKNQIISQIDETILSNLSLENRLWRLSNGDTSPIINSNQLSVGLLYQKKGWSFDIDHYNKNIDGITALSLGFLNPDGKTFRIGNQKIKGVDFYVKKNYNNFNTWVSYSYTDVRSKFKNLNNDNYFTANTNITHAIATSVAYKKKQFQIALGWKWRTGKPYTKSVLTNNEITFEGINTERLDNYHRLDLSTTYGFRFAKRSKLKGKVGISIRNVYNQKNQLSREYSGFNTINDPIKIRDMYSLGFTPNFFFGVYW